MLKPFPLLVPTLDYKLSMATSFTYRTLVLSTTHLMLTELLQLVVDQRPYSSLQTYGKTLYSPTAASCTLCFIPHNL